MASLSPALRSQACPNTSSSPVISTRPSQLLPPPTSLSPSVAVVGDGVAAEVSCSSVVAMGDSDDVAGASVFTVADGVIGASVLIVAGASVLIVAGASVLIVGDGVIGASVFTTGDDVAAVSGEDGPHLTANADATSSAAQLNRSDS